MDIKYSWILSLLLLASTPIMAQEDLLPGLPVPKVSDTTVRKNSFIILQENPGLERNRLTETSLYIQPVRLGFFCKFEDHINQDRKIRLDFGTD